MGNEALIAKAARAFNKVRIRFFGAAADLELLKSSLTANAYDTVATIGEDWFFDTERNEVYIAKDSVDLQSDMNIATHLRIDGGQIYSIVPDDTTAPDTKAGGRVYWTIACEKFAKRSQFSNLY